MSRDSICVLSGGTGTPKLLQGLMHLVSPEALKIIVNTADDVWMGDLYVSPDIDTVLYTLAGIVDEEKWYGLRGDTYRAYESRKRKGFDDILRLGDHDREMVAFRSSLMAKGLSLSEAVEEQRARLGIRQQVWPMSDQRVQTYIRTPAGEMEFQEFWVRRGGRDEILSIEFRGIEDAFISRGAKAALDSAKAVIIGPSNPVTSIGPIIHTRGVVELLKETRVVAVSPLRSGAVFSGPAGKMLRALGYDVSPTAIAQLYREFLDGILIDPVDSKLTSVLKKSYGIETYVHNLEMRTQSNKFKLARAALAAATKGETIGRRRGAPADYRGKDRHHSR